MGVPASYARPTVSGVGDVRRGEAMSNGNMGERMRLVDETQADRQTIEAYELITRKMRVPRVPLFFRALAGEKALLPCFQALRPAIRLRAFEEAGDELRVKAGRAPRGLGGPPPANPLAWGG